MLETEKFDQVTCIKTASPLGGQAMMWVYAYQIENVLFDAGCANAIAELKGHLAKQPIRDVFVTHNHEDHFGGCAAFLPDATIHAGPVTAKMLKKPIELPEFFQVVWGQAEPLDTVEHIPETISFDDFTFEQIDLSGHCEEMVGFWEPERRWLFSTDAVPLPSKKQMAMPEENIPLMISRMEEIQLLDPEILFDGHRGPIKQPQKHIQMRIDFLRNLQQKVQRLAEEGKTIAEIKAVLGFPEPWYLPNTEGRFGIEYLIRSLIEDRA
jgi:glyoxylase-like metal-dependent hydrolase (beta-lactamase superfamily II)